MDMTIAQNTHIQFFNKQQFSLKEAYSANPGFAESTIRARVYEKLGVLFERVAKGVYKCINVDDRCILIEGDGRDLSMFDNESIDCIITDHPWQDKKSNKGGNRNFTPYECFLYKLKDFEEKFRVLKPGAFLVEIIPEENEKNFEYLYQLKKMALEAGFKYYSKVSWRKGGIPSNNGRKVSGSEDVLFLTKGKPRVLRYDAQRSKLYGEEKYMSGASKMQPEAFRFEEDIISDQEWYTHSQLPDEFDITRVSRKEELIKTEKPVKLLEEIITMVTKAGEVVLDTFAGSGSTGVAAINTNRIPILIEKSKEHFDIIVNRFKKHLNTNNLTVITK